MGRCLCVCIVGSSGMRGGPRLGSGGGRGQLCRVRGLWAGNPSLDVLSGFGVYQNHLCRLQGAPGFKKRKKK